MTTKPRFAKMREDLLNDDDISDGAKIMWCKLYMQAFSLGQDYVTLKHQEIAALCDKTIRTVERYQAELEDGGYLPVDRVTEDGFKVANIYHLPDTTNMSYSDEQAEAGITPVHSDATYMSGRSDRGEWGKSPVGADTTKMSHIPYKDSVKDQTSARFARPAVTDEFAEAWKLYPFRKGNQLEAQRGWAGWIESGEEPSTLLAAVKNYAAKVESEGTVERYVMNAQRFLGSEGVWLQYAAAEYAPEPQLSRDELKARYVAQMTQADYDALEREWDVERPSKLLPNYIEHLWEIPWAPGDYNPLDPREVFPQFAPEMVPA